MANWWVTVEDSRGTRLVAAVSVDGNASEVRGRKHFWVNHDTNLSVSVAGYHDWARTLRFDGDRDVVARLTKTNDPTPGPGPGPGPSPVPITLGRWSGNFLYPAPLFFGPACAAFPADKRAEYFSHLISRGDTHVLINADQADWGPSKGHPEWTEGGIWALDDLPRFLSVVAEARAAGLIPIIGLIDQPRLKVEALDQVIRHSRQLVEATHEDCACYMLSWEIDEVWTHGDVREPNIRRWIASVDWHSRDMGIHYADGLRGGVNFYGSLPSGATRFMQWNASVGTAQLAQEARLIADVAVRTHTKVCAFEHSSPVNQTPTHTEAEATQRAQAAMAAFRAFPLDPTRFGSLNG